ncbi:NB-ARC domain-containing protein [Limnoraphis robusta Tam1]|uniref:NB-ARC domain-containing protein n=1 Tax=Limnoraphis robusta TaxID=1118279 RepID=UPI002B1FE7CB|nr:NB-ARC domain-containing protein [Limnoraphis robusta]MEA5497042.1 NB-ARC domain-containing protein [Limnoraphis robusta BA-68 BA1]MEA5539556.1 NB-ARC domain-containing protein [Limnoraphis robusta Tam1]
MENSQLKKLLADVENPKLEFKSSWYCGADKLDDKGWGEFLKDIIALANGNVGYTGQTAYLIIGASNKDPDPDQLRETFHVNDSGMLSDLQMLRDTTLRKLRQACSPSPSDIKMYFFELEDNKNLLIIEIFPPVDVVKLDRDLNTRGIRFKKGTVLIRVGQDVEVADPTEISALKQEYDLRYQKEVKVQQKVLHNLPQPDYLKFVGRKNELERLHKLLHPQDRVWTIVIDGIGGIGKSALALEVAYRYLRPYDFLPPEERFEAIIWISAKTSVLTAEGVKARYHFTNTIGEIYQEIFITVDKNSDKNCNDYSEKNILIKRALSRQRTLLILDNYETIDDEQVNSFIRELPNPTKCIVTTRHRIDIADPIRLSAMPREDALSLIQQECQKKDVQLTEEQAELLYRRTAGVPLAVVWSIAQVSFFGYGIDTVLRRLGDAKGDIARFCFENAVQDIQDQPAFKLIICLALSTGSYIKSSLSRQELGYIADLSELDRDEGLVALEKLSLINKNGNQFSILSLVKEYIIYKLSSISVDELKEIAIRISINYAPSARNVIVIFEKNKILETQSMSLIKKQITDIVVDKMWQWYDHGDETGVGYCIHSLEYFANDEAIYNIKHIAISDIFDDRYISSGWLQIWAVDALTNLKRIAELIELILVADDDLINVIYKALERIEVEEVVLEIDKRIESFFGQSTKKQSVERLQQFRDKITSK